MSCAAEGGCGPPRIYVHKQKGLAQILPLMQRPCTAGAGCGPHSPHRGRSPCATRKKTAADLFDLPQFGF